MSQSAPHENPSTGVPSDEWDSDDHFDFTSFINEDPDIDLNISVEGDSSALTISGSFHVCHPYLDVGTIEDAIIGDLHIPGLLVPHENPSIGVLSNEWDPDGFCDFTSLVNEDLDFDLDISVEGNFSAPTISGGLHGCHPYLDVGTIEDAIIGVLHIPGLYRYAIRLDYSSEQSSWLTDQGPLFESASIREGLQQRTDGIIRLPSVKNSRVDSEMVVQHAEEGQNGGGMEDRQWWSSAVGMATLWGEMDIEIVISHAENGRRMDVVAMGDWHEQEELILVFGGRSTEGVGGNISAVLMLSVVFVDHKLLLEKASPSSPSLTVGVKDILAPSRSFPRISIPFLCVSHPCHEPSPIFKPSARIPLSSLSMWLDYAVAAASILLV
ncbi:hypothetical protein EDD85DRAFT_952109 [Armillaria nabsnona]|nr:hypothetical protein EDD85DRAFT_952109 [Armillaria nabsnona]